ncbi:MAG: hypothetical protein JNM43_04265 [Planctomycetaceae bacterium]|nr:hypothetical protein [Planctomycetaceae bacterium]
MTNPMERMQAGDPYLNYCLWPYAPVCSGIGKLRPSALLHHAVQSMLHCDWVRQTLARIQAGLGCFRSVYGIKRIGSKWALEIYLYDYARQQRTVSVEALEFATGGWLRFPSVDPRTPYFMFSFDLNDDAEKLRGQLDCVHVYIGNPGSDVSSGISYEYSRRGRQLENFYFFFDGQRHQREIVDKIECSVFSEAWNPILDELYRPELRDCQTVCLANKRTCDTVYFSGVTVHQLLFFLQWQSYPSDHIDFVIQHISELDHLRYDVGVDYRVKAGQVEFIKSGYYGVF